MLRNLILGSLLASLGAALPVIVFFIAVGFVRAIAEADVYPLSAGIVQSLYAIIAAYFFGWIAALLVGTGGLGSWPTLAMYSALGANGSLFSAMIIGIDAFASEATA